MSVELVGVDLRLQLHHLRKLIEEPRVDLCQPVDLVDRITVLQGVGDV